MYSYEDRMRAVTRYIKLGKRVLSHCLMYGRAEVANWISGQFVRYGVPFSDCVLALRSDQAR